jgi:hypothetical protein
MNLLGAQSLPVPFLAVSNRPSALRVGGRVHLFVLTPLDQPPGRRAARMSLCNRFAASPEAFAGAEYTRRFEQHGDTCPRCWSYLKSYLVRNEAVKPRRVRR